MAARALIAFAGALWLWIAPAAAAELVMVDQRSCVYCAKFNRQVGKTYAESRAGHVAPLRRVSRLKKWPKDLAHVTPAYATPTFIVVDNGREIGRFAGFSSPETFWARLDPLLASATRPAVEPDLNGSTQVPLLPRPRPEPSPYFLDLLAGRITHSLSGLY